MMQRDELPDKRKMKLSERFPVTCPRCKSGVGTPCVSAFGNFTLAHTSRSDATYAQGTSIIRDFDPDELRRFNRLYREELGRIDADIGALVDELDLFEGI